MKTNKPFFIITVIMLVAYLLSACGGLPQQAAQPSGEQAGLKVRASVVAYTGVVEAINGTEWTVNGQVLSVDPVVVQDGPFQVGDTIKIEGSVNPDGTITVSGVGAPLATDLIDLPQIGDPPVGGVINDNTNDNTNVNNNANDNSNDDDSNANGNSNDDDSNSNGNSNDDDNNSSGNSYDDDDDNDGNHSSSGNSNGSKNGGGSNDSHDDDDGGGSNSNDDDDDD